MQKSVNIQKVSSSITLGDTRQAKENRLRRSVPLVMHEGKNSQHALVGSCNRLLRLRDELVIPDRPSNPIGRDSCFRMFDAGKAY
jgi:hypothetical protein